MGATDKNVFELLDGTQADGEPCTVLHMHIGVGEAKVGTHGFYALPGLAVLTQAEDGQLIAKDDPAVVITLDP